MRGVTGEKDPVHLPALGDPGMEGVDGLAHHAHGRVALEGAQQVLQAFVAEHLLIGFIGLQHELEAPGVVRAGNLDHRTTRIAVDPCLPEGVSVLVGVDHQPARGKARTDHLDTQLFAHRAAATVAGDQVVGTDIQQLSAGVTNQCPYAV